MRYEKVLLALAIMSSIALGQEKQVQEDEKKDLKAKGLFIGIDYEKISSDLRYNVDSQNQLNFIPGANETYKEPAFKIGYQYYFTRLYFKYSSLSEKAQDYTVDSKSYELDAEYLPIFYRGNSFALRGVFGVSLGYMDSELNSLSTRFEQEAGFVGLNDFSDKQAAYGAQVGVMFELDFGLSVELGYRYRRASLIESENSDGKVSFETKRRQLYGGVNYLF